MTPTPTGGQQTRSMTKHTHNECFWINKHTIKTDSGENNTCLSAGETDGRENDRETEGGKDRRKE